MEKPIYSSVVDSGILLIVDMSSKASVIDDFKKICDMQIKRWKLVKKIPIIIRDYSSNWHIVLEESVESLGTDNYNKVKSLVKKNNKKTYWSDL